MKVALVTGAGGFMGRHMIDYLRARGARVTGSGRSAGLRCDLLDSGAARRLVGRLQPATIYHLAGTTKGLSWDALWAAHVAATVNLLEAVRALPDPSKVTVVISGSSAEYGDPGPRPVRETFEGTPLGPYGSSKLGQTLAALSFGALGLDVRVARIFNAIGAGIPERLAAGSFASQVARIEKGLQPPLIKAGDLSPLRDFVDARDAVAALAAIASRGRAGETYNVGSGRATPVRAVLDGLLALSPAAIRVERAETRSHSAGLRRIHADSGKIRRQTGWAPRFTLEDSLRAALDSWRTAA